MTALERTQWIMPRLPEAAHNRVVTADDKTNPTARLRAKRDLRSALRGLGVEVLAKRNRAKPKEGKETAKLVTEPADFSLNISLTRAEQFTLEIGASIEESDN